MSDGTDPAGRLPLDIPALDIAWEADPRALAALLAHVQANWTRLGELRPHWSVQANDAYAPDRIEANRAAFDASGAAELGMLRACLARHGRTPSDFRRVCDYGCGVGRITLPLAGAFAAVLACDVSPAHLALARLEAGQRGLRNVVFSLVNAADFGMADPFDLWFSHLVLQHNPPPVTAAILRRMFARLAPGGIAVFQLLTYLRGYAFAPDTYLAQPLPMGEIEMHVLPQQAVFALAAAAGCIALEVREDSAVWPPSVCTSNTFIFRKA